MINDPLLLLQNETARPQTRQYARSSYQGAFERNLTPVEIILELYKAIIINLDAAKIAYQQNDLSKMCVCNKKNFLIISALKDNIDKKNATDFGSHLDYFYTVLFFKLARIMESQNIVGEYEEMRNTVIDVYHFWEKLRLHAHVPDAKHEGSAV